MNRGTRENQNKPRHDLISPIAMNDLALVLTHGASKYSDRNWEDGLEWSKGIIGSLKRHLAAFEMGIDNDEETGYPHTAHIIANAHFLAHMFHARKDLDDRSVTMKKMLCSYCHQRIGDLVKGIRVCNECDSQSDECIV